MSLSRNQRYEQNMKKKGLRKMTLWVPEEAASDTAELMDYIKDQYIKPLEQRRRLIPFMFRDLDTGVMGRPK